LATKESVGWATSKSPNADLAKAALINAIQRQQADPAQGKLHSYQGVHNSLKLS